MKILSTKRYKALCHDAKNAEDYAERFRKKCEDFDRLEKTVKDVLDKNKYLYDMSEKLRFDIERKDAEIERLKNLKKKTVKDAKKKKNTGEKPTVKTAKSEKGGKKKEEKGGKSEKVGKKKIQQGKV